MLATLLVTVATAFAIGFLQGRDVFGADGYIAAMPGELFFAVVFFVLAAVCRHTRACWVLEACGMGAAVSLAVIYGRGYGARSKDPPR